MDTYMNEEYIREVFEVNCRNLEIPENAVWHEDEQRYTLLSLKQHFWLVFKEAFNLGILYGRN